MGLFSIFLYTFTIKCDTAAARKMPIEYMFCSSREKCDLFGSVFKKIIPNSTTPTFQEVGGVT